MNKFLHRKPTQTEFVLYDPIVKVVMMISTSQLWTFHFLYTILVVPANGVYISQLILYAMACISYHKFPDRWLLLIILLNQEFRVVNFKSYLRKFVGRNHELVDCYGIYICLTDDVIFVLLVVTTILSLFPEHYLQNKTYYGICFDMSKTINDTC